MFTAALATLMNSFANIFWQKSLQFWVGWKIHDLLSYPISILLLVILLVVWVDFSQISPYIVLGICAIVTIDAIKLKMNQSLYKEEKYSVIAPYTNLNKILIIIGSFFVFNDVSVVSLIITLIAVLVIVFFTIDFKTLKLPRNIKKVVFLECLNALVWFTTWWLILTYSENLYFSIYVVIAGITMSILVWKLWEIKTLKSVPKTFWFYRYLWWLWWVSRFLWMTIIKNLWLSISILLSFLWIGAALLFSYIFSKDIPAKKDILLTIIVTALVGLGFYFK